LVTVQNIYNPRFGQNVGLEKKLEKHINKNLVTDYEDNKKLYTEKQKKWGGRRTLKRLLKGRPERVKKWPNSTIA